MLISAGGIISAILSASGVAGISSFFSETGFLFFMSFVSTELFSVSVISFCEAFISLSGKSDEAFFSGKSGTSAAGFE